MALTGGALDQRPQQQSYNQEQDLIRRMNSNNPRERIAAQREYQRIQALQTRQSEVSAATTSRQQESEANRLSREDIARENREQRKESEADRNVEKESTRLDRRNAGLLSLMQSREFQTVLSGKAPPGMKAMVDQYLVNNGINPSTVYADAAASPQKQALQRVAGKAIPGTKNAAFNVGPTENPMAGPGAQAPTAAAGGSSLEGQYQEHPRGVGGGDPFNWLAYKQGIGGTNFAKIYGMDDPAMMKSLLDMYHGSIPPAADISQMYAGTPTIPTGPTPRGYYDKAGKFLGPAYTPEGGHIHMPKGATGLYGTADLDPAALQQYLATLKTPTGATTAFTPGAPTPAGGAPAQAAAPAAGGGRGWHIGAFGIPYYGEGGGAAPSPAAATAVAPPQRATNRPFFGSPELAGGEQGAQPAVAAATQKPSGPPITFDVDKFLKEHVGQPSMEDLRIRQGVPTFAPQTVTAPPDTTNQPTLYGDSPNVKAFRDALWAGSKEGQFAKSLTEAPPASTGPQYGTVRVANEVGQPGLPNPAPPENVLPQFNPAQQAALEAQRRAEEEARRRAAEEAAARQASNQ